MLERFTARSLVEAKADGQRPWWKLPRRVLGVLRPLKAGKRQARMLLTREGYVQPKPFACTSLAQQRLPARAL